MTCNSRYPTDAISSIGVSLKCCPHRFSDCSSAKIGKCNKSKNRYPIYSTKKKAVLGRRDGITDLMDNAELSHSKVRFICDIARNK